MTKIKYLRKSKAASIVELCFGLLILTPVILFLIDLIFMSLYKTETDSLAKRCAIAVGSTNYGTTDPTAVPPSSYQNAAQAVLNTYSSPSLSGSPSVVVYYINDTSNPTAGNPNPTLSSNVTNSPTPQTDGVATIVTATWKLPVAVPFGGPSTLQLQARASSPLVGDLSNSPSTAY